MVRRLGLCLGGADVAFEHLGEGGDRHEQQGDSENETHGSLSLRWTRNLADRMILVFGPPWVRRQPMTADIGACHLVDNRMFEGMTYASSDEIRSTERADFIDN
jgi:hypothetical protein